MVRSKAEHLTPAVELPGIGLDRVGQGINGGGLEFAEPFQSGSLAKKPVASAEGPIRVARVRAVGHHSVFAHVSAPTPRRAFARWTFPSVSPG